MPVDQNVTSGDVKQQRALPWLLALIGSLLCLSMILLWLYNMVFDFINPGLILGEIDSVWQFFISFIKNVVLTIYAGGAMLYFWKYFMPQLLIKKAG
jgi:hypothetical protein